MSKRTWGKRNECANGEKRKSDKEKLGNKQVSKWVKRSKRK